MTIYRTLLVGFILALAGCSKKLPLAATPPQQPPIPAVELIEPHIRFQFAVYYLPTPNGDPLQELDAVLKADFPEILRLKEIPKEINTISLAARLNEDVGKTYAPPTPEAVQRVGHGLNNEQTDNLQESQQALILDFGYPKERAWEHLQTAHRLLSVLSRKTGGLIWDEETREIFTAQSWDERRLQGWERGAPDISKHTVIHAYKADQLVRGISLGMKKFGLPDIVIEDFPWSASKRLGSIINLFAQALAEGARVERAGEFDLDLNSILHPDVRDPQLQSLKNHATAKIALTLREGVWEEGDPQNRLIELGFDRYPGNDAHAKQDAAIATLFGWQDAIKRVKHNDEVNAASQRAKAKLPLLRTAFNNGLLPGEYIQVKAPFPVASTGGNEWMWVEVVSWVEGHIKGLLKNEPFQIPKLHAGQIVEVEESTVFDYIRRFPDGTQEGNETGPILEQMMGSEEKR